MLLAIALLVIVLVALAGHRIDASLTAAQRFCSTVRPGETLVELTRRSGALGMQERGFDGGAGADFYIPGWMRAYSSCRLTLEKDVVVTARVISVSD